MSGIVGVIVGFGLSYITSRHKDKGRLEDELTKARRELASQKRVLNDFFSSSNALFEQLESSYQIYAHHIGEQSKKIVPQLGNIFETTSHISNTNSDSNNVDKNQVTEVKNIEETKI
jgi:uncharacterized membrane-anchored protein YhcB (DUF1043 family)